MVYIYNVHAVIAVALIAIIHNLTMHVHGPFQGKIYVCIIILGSNSAQLATARSIKMVKTDMNPCCGSVKTTMTIIFNNYS